jgi:hypothetical protein
MKAVLYNATTSTQMNNINDFVELYNQMYYFQTSRKIEEIIEHYLKKDDLKQEDFLNIFAWKTNWVNHKLSEYYDGRFEYVGGKNDNNKKWMIEPNEDDPRKGKATAVTRHGPIDKDSDNALYDFLTTLVDLQNEKIKAKDLLDKMADKAPEGIGTVYLITFLYFITNGTEPIYDVFAMAALDAMYPYEDEYIMEYDLESEDNETKKVDESKSRLGTYIKPRYLPQKGEGGFDHLFDTKKYAGGNWSKYAVYKKKIKLFEKELNKYRKEKGLKPKYYDTCRDIDRALWVYGHFFRSEKTEGEKEL